MSFGGTDDLCSQMRCSDRKVRWFLDVGWFGDSKGKRSVTASKIIWQSVTVAWQLGSDFFFGVGLRQAVMHSLKAVMIVLILTQMDAASIQDSGRVPKRYGDESSSNTTRIRDLLVGHGPEGTPIDFSLLPGMARLF